MTRQNENHVYNLDGASNGPNYNVLTCYAQAIKTNAELITRNERKEEEYRFMNGKHRAVHRRAALFVIVIVTCCLFAGCGKGTRVSVADTDLVITDNGANDREKVAVNAGSSDENASNFNHGHSITETESERPREIKRSLDIVIHNADEALEYLKDCVVLQDDDLVLKLTDTSEDDPGAYMWYDFMVFYDGVAVENAVFTVIAFTDGTVAEGRTEFLTCTMADRSKALSTDEALSKYVEKYGVDRQYEYKASGYFFTGKGDAECPYAYTYRYDCGKVLENVTLVLDSETGERIGSWPDAIN